MKEECKHERCVEREECDNASGIHNLNDSGDIYGYYIFCFNCDHIIYHCPFCKMYECYGDCEQ